MPRIINQLNLQESLGGGEVYTRLVVKACTDLGWSTRVFVSPRAAYWPGLLPEGTQIVKLQSMAELEVAVADKGSVLLTHSTLDAQSAQRMAQRTILAGILHMPLYERLPEGLRHYHRLIAVSRHVADSARSRGLPQVSEVELLGVADTHPRGKQAPLRRHSSYDWDRRKLRDRMMGWFAALWPDRSGGAEFVRVAGTLTLGIVSRLTPIKQFPLMFGHLAPIIARHPSVRLEIFGSGGYASVRDLRSALQPCAAQVRFWGQQSDVGALYPKLDYVLSGLPEKEALGLNLIEAQSCGTPVLAVAAPPFTETVVDGETGFLYEDPRKDGGASFKTLLEGLVGNIRRPDPRCAASHLERFSETAFRARLQNALEGL